MSLTVDGKVLRPRLHRLIATAFHSNPDNKPIVHHIDCNVKNNKAENLLWVTEEEHKAIHDELRKKGNNNNEKDNKR